MKRRSFIKSLPIVGPCLVAGAESAASQSDQDLSQLIRAIEELEVEKEWESTSTSAAKAYCAYKIRAALGLEIVDEAKAKQHVNFHSEQFEAYRRSVWFCEKPENGNTVLSSDTL